VHVSSFRDVEIPDRSAVSMQKLNTQRAVCELGERIVFEPRSVITYVDDPTLEPFDRSYQRFRWDFALGERSVATLLERWPVMGDYFRRNVEWMKANQRRAAEPSARRTVRRLQGRT
jgi:hypothetical protein